ncbi:MAG: Altered inheritance of mitochondria protein 18 mitochondrial [Bathelium mastoideum]|nr:MAG: Altered inheritance of mitochondria protein 18 mitochondrial [Bathelium mastoideum]
MKAGSIAAPFAVRVRATSCKCRTPFQAFARQTRHLFQPPRPHGRELDAGPRNPIDPVAAHRHEAIRRAYWIRRNKFMFVGAVVCMIAPVVILYASDIPTVDPQKTKDGMPQRKSSFWPRENADSNSKATETFAGKPVHVIPGGKVLAEDPDSRTGAEVELLETGTSTIPHFPKTIHIPEQNQIAGTTNVTDDEYTLVGLGIRTVSFLSIQVYVLGMYVRTTDIGTLQSAMIRQVDPVATALVPSEKDQLRQKLLDPEGGRVAWEQLLRDNGIRTAFRIVPTRNTDFAHLRDGWVRGVTARTQEATKRGDLSYEDEQFGTSMRDFKTIFGGKGKAPKGSVLLLTRDERGKLGALYQEKEGKGVYQTMGVVNDERIGRLVWMGYLAGKNVSSESARKGIVDGVMEFVERPVGTVETRIS